MPSDRKALAKRGAPEPEGINVGGLLDKAVSAMQSSMKGLLDAVEAAVSHEKAPQALKKILFHESAGGVTPGGGVVVWDTTGLAEFDAAASARMAEAIANKELAAANGKIELLEKQATEAAARAEGKAKG
ncbi:MAG: hypothetical protein M1352_03570 [Patescibacteria group bacterium]|nr:hypothetical protein [Patescibacteria group bacterium]